MRRSVRTTGLLAAALTTGTGVSNAMAQDVAVEATRRHPMTVEDLWAMDRISAAALSPDGNHAAFSVTRYSMETNKGESNL